MKIFVFENVLTDWTSGMVVIAAETLQDAVCYAELEFGSSEDQFGSGDSWKDCIAGEYPTTDCTRAGVLHTVYGGS